MSQQPPSRLDERYACRSEPDGGPALDEFEVQPLFQLLNLLAEWWLCDSHASGGAAKMRLVSQGAHVTEVPELGAKGRSLDRFHIL